MLPQEIKELIERYCWGKEPTDEQMGEIMKLMFTLDADAEEVSDYIKKLQSKDSCKVTTSEIAKSASDDIETYFSDSQSLEEKISIFESTVKRDPYKALAMCDEIANDLAEVENVEQLDHVVNSVNMVKAALCVMYIPEKASEGFDACYSFFSKSNDEELDANVAIALFYAYAFGSGTTKDGERAYEMATYALAHADDEEECLSGLLASFMCFCNKWGTPNKALDDVTRLKMEADYYYKISFLLKEDISSDLFEWEKDLLIQYGLLGGQAIEKARQMVVDELVNSLVGGFEYVRIFKSNVPMEVCKYLVTRRQWEIIMGDEILNGEEAEYPVVNITYEEAEEFVSKVNKKTPISVNLEIPINDAQWMTGGYQAVFAKENSKFSHLGVNLSVRLNVIWCSENSNNQLHPVGSGKERAGIYDACGLAYEFCKMKNNNLVYGGDYRTPYIDCLKLKKSIQVCTGHRYPNVGLRLVRMLS